MRWFKHMTTSANDEKLSRLRDECGLSGYGFYWAVLEIIASQMDDSGKTFCAYSKRAWCMRLAINHQTWSKLIASCEQAGLFVVSEDGQTIQVDAPNLVKFRDEWTDRQHKKSGVTREKLPYRARVPETDTETEEDKNTPPPPCGGCVSGLASPSPEPEPEPPLQEAEPLADMGIEFHEFIAAYPVDHREPVGGAANAWRKLAREKKLPGLPRLLDGITAWEESEQWQKDGGRFIVSAENFLRKAMWLGAPPRASPKSDISGAIERMKKLAASTAAVSVPA